MQGELSSQRILRRALLGRIASNQAYSLRALARDLGVSHTLLSLILSGKRRLSIPRAIAFSQVLGLPEQERQELIGSSLASTPPPERKKNSPGSRAQPFSLEVDSFRYLSEWYHSAILEMMLLKGFRPDISWIAKRLSISSSDCRSAVARLKRMGLIESDGKNGWVKRDAVIHIRSKESHAAIRSYHREMIGRGLNAFRSSKPEDFSRRNITGVTFPCDPTKLEAASKKIARLRKELVKLLWTEESTEVYQLNVQLFPLTNGGAK